jgi:hypothetical protein
MAELEFFAGRMRRVDDQDVRPLDEAFQNILCVRGFQIEVSPVGGSTLITSAPKSDRITAAPGPAMKLARSTTFSPEKMLSLVMGHPF